MDFHAVSKVYRDTVFGFVRVFFLIGVGLFLLFSCAAVFNLLFKVGWSYSWREVLLGLVGAAASYAGSLFVRAIHRALGHVFD